jgi:2-hydroxychromene-2-carboxylate isomerase
VKTIRFYFDPVSPYAALAFWRLPEALVGRSYTVDYVPILFAASLKAHGHKGPAEIAPKRAWTYRQVAWLAREQGVPLRMPAAHPFNPLSLLRLAWACAPEGLTPSRRVVARLMAHVWLADGAAVDDATRWAALTAELAPPQAPDGEVVKQRLRAATDEALARGVFGVPTFEFEGRLFWGQDSLPMLAAAMDGDAWFDGPAWSEAETLPVGFQRNREQG